MNRALLLAAVAASMIAGGYAGECNQELFCKRWMCEQNEHRREILQKELGDDYSLELLNECNAQQTQPTGSQFETTCTLSGYGTFDLGMRYDLTTCDTQAKPEQLLVPDANGANQLSVMAFSNARVQVNTSKTWEATYIYGNESSKCGRANFQPTHPCICDGTSWAPCINEMKYDVFYDWSSPQFQEPYYDRFSGELVNYNEWQVIDLGVVTADSPRAEAISNCAQLFGQASCTARSPAPRRDPKWARREARKKMDATRKKMDETMAEARKRWAAAKQNARDKRAAAKELAQSKKFRRSSPAP